MPRSRLLTSLSSIKALSYVSLCALGLIQVSCAPSSFKARLDTTFSGGIVWPGSPERPRIKYLWSLQDVGVPSEEKKNEILSLLAGDGGQNITDPQDFPVLVRPQGIYVDERRLYIADPGAFRVTVIDRKTMDVMHIVEAYEEWLEYPRGIAADVQGNIFVSDPELKKLIAYSAEGKFRFFFEGDFLRPEGIAFDKKRGLLYVADTYGHIIYVYGTDGKRLGSIGRLGRAAGEFYYPTYIAVDRSGNLYVTDSLNFRIQVFSPDGSFLRALGTLGDSFNTLDKPKGVAADSEGHIYVVDGARHMVKIFDQDGRLLLFFGEKGERYGDFYLPAGIFIDERDIIYVADSLNMRVQAFQFLGGD